MPIITERRHDNADPSLVVEYRRDRGGLMAPQRIGDVVFAQGYACKPGILEYRNDDGTITRELVTDEVLRDAAMGLSRIALTLRHPRQDVSSKNWSELAVGDTDKDVVIDDNGYQKVTLCVRRKDAQEAMMTGKLRELSCGYKAKIDRTPGEHPEFGRYDARQVSRDYNHLAIVEEARAGRDVAIRTDEASELPVAHMVTTIRGDSAVEQPTTGGHMPITAALVRRLALLGIDATRFDSAEEALTAVLDRRADMGPPMAPHQPDEGPDYPTNEDGSPRYLDDDGSPMTMDAYVEKLENDNAMMAEQLQGDADEQAMDELKPMAEDEEVEVEKGDSAYDLAHRIASKVVGQQLHPEASPEFIWGVIEARKADSAKRHDGRQAGRDVWANAERRADSNHARREREAWRNELKGEEGREDSGVDLGAISLSHYRNDFEAARKRARGIN